MSTFIPIVGASTPTPSIAASFSPLVTEGVTRAVAPEPAALPEEQPAATATAPAPCHDQPRVTLVREQDRVTRIVIECACGRKTELDCVY